ncbi:hypothetical protein J6590_012085 [Homalodisca vitripennis]|nr:hypothetical protein J6590_012085 [Homalodisca vitripennis]
MVSTRRHCGRDRLVAVVAGSGLMEKARRVDEAHNSLAAACLRPVLQKLALSQVDRGLYKSAELAWPLRCAAN